MNRILWHSNAPWCPSGYGVQTSLFTPRLRDMLDYNVACSAFFGLWGACLSWEGLQVYPAGYNGWGNDVLEGHALQHFQDLQEGLVISLMDTWCLDPAVTKRLNIACWTPIDHVTVPPAVAGVIREGEIIPIAMSRHGEHAMKQEGFDPLYVPHGVDTEFYCPAADEEERAAHRRALNWPEDAFIVGMVAANRGYPSRKSFPEAIAAFAQFTRTVDKDAVLYLHTEMHGKHQGVQLWELVKRHGIKPENLRFFDPYHYVIGGHPELLRSAYQSMDVLLNPSMGEGFGIPIIEAQACGTPVIVTDVTSMTELAGSGWLVGGHAAWTDQRAYQVIPDTDDILKALTSAHSMAGRMRTRAREFALEYDANLVTVKYWRPAIAEAIARCSSVEEVVPA